ncbi:MAG: 1-acyl-sn-glycerol-3-phosphate acyltransferase [Deltaproteobacteria bacterium]|nr:1-acyl-sn-glycerol-3-phosphate acyltransferase [Deltaproteobacteria bacterium]
MDRFADIRPYRDNEVRRIIDNLLFNREFISTIRNLRFPWMPGFVSRLLDPLVRMRLAREFESVNDVRAFQDLVKNYMNKVFRNTITEFKVSGLEHIDPGPYIFMCNHRDIAMDPTLVNYAMLEDGRDSARIAIGDNLLSRPFASDLMRLNKCFIVKRSVRGRQALEAFRTLSAYISHSIFEEKVSIWIAQKEGRAKDGNDFTEAAIIKMFAMNRDKTSESFDEYIKRLRIVPVAISYEYDPCDGLKAAELFNTDRYGEYRKGEDEDLKSIALGIIGYKGAIHVSFGSPLKDNITTPDAAASAVDRQIIGSYHLHSTNFIAYRELYGDTRDISLLNERDAFNPDEYSRESRIFQRRIDSMPPEHRKYALAIYANPVANKIKIISGASS